MDGWLSLTLEYLDTILGGQDWQKIMQKLIKRNLELKKMYGRKKIFQNIARVFQVLDKLNNHLAKNVELTFQDVVSTIYRLELSF